MILIGSAVVLSWCGSSQPKNSLDTGDWDSWVLQQPDSADNQWFKSDGLATDTSKTSIDLELVLDWWPWKDGIPSIDTPSFVQIDDESNDYLSDESEGIFVEMAGEKRRYSYNILNRHEIVNDVFGEGDAQRHLSVTFCPLCGSAIVFDRLVDGNILEFGVSGKLLNSNLLMYDRSTESLWSQALGKAVVGEYLDTKLDIVDADVITREEVKEYHPEAVILSTDTWAQRSYERIPYGTYDTNDDLFFPVENLEDARLPLKTRMFITNISDEISLAYHMENLRTAWEWEIDVDGVIYTASFEEWDRKITDPEGNELPGYFEMRFSRANKNERSKYVWDE